MTAGGPPPREDAFRRHKDAADPRQYPRWWLAAGGGLWLAAALFLVWASTAIEIAAAFAVLLAVGLVDARVRRRHLANRAHWPPDPNLKRSPYKCPNCARWLAPHWSDERSGEIVSMGVRRIVFLVFLVAAGAVLAGFSLGEWVFAAIAVPVLLATLMWANRQGKPPETRFYCTGCDKVFRGDFIRAGGVQGEAPLPGG